MSPFFSNRRLIVLLVCLIFLVGLIGYSLSDQRGLSWPEQFIQDSVGTVQSVFSRPAYMISNAVDSVNELRNVYEENQMLRSHLDEYAALQSELTQLQRRNDELEEAMDVQDNLLDYSVRNATVIHRSPDRWNELIGINLGAQHGIEQDMAVITSQGLIGKIRDVSQFSSSVQLLSDQDANNRISAMAESDDETIYGFMEGIDDETGHLRFTKIDVDIEVEEGMIVSTSGLGGVFPDGLTIGEIVDVTTDEYGLSQTALVEPAADYYHLDYVMVIERGASQTSLFDELDEEEEDMVPQIDPEADPDEDPAADPEAVPEEGVE
ncbi:rod shape-determining protein MreC [Alkalicoccus luteus]|uniref:Cell shape-determining protein MreC n=1 Tax=Alkalicoccus luteus TaxID=1237094 RepID=A0A969TTX9_9BACI|nr:rod shape-determining protein MreC [Alkalicoccus luteus]NJP36760.1 rod shape-determining protein MreC [Alkalicoccus luteus]